MRVPRFLPLFRLGDLVRFIIRIPLCILGIGRFYRTDSESFYYIVKSVLMLLGFSNEREEDGYGGFGSLKPRF